MTEETYILAVDQGTSSTKTIVFSTSGEVIAKATEPLKTIYSEGGFVEQDAEDIYLNVLASVKKCIADFKHTGASINDIKTCGISNQRETFVVWGKDGVPLHNAVVWQCKRSIAVCEKLKETEGLEDTIKANTGLIIDPYFSGTKLIWLYENDHQIKQAIDSGEAYFGTIDTWLLFKLSGGRRYLTDHTNASRTLFFNLHTLQWDKLLLKQFGLEKLNLPQIRSSAFDFGESDFAGLFDSPVKIGSMIGDSHAAAFGEGCTIPGTAKATLGTGCSVMMNIGTVPKSSASGMVTTICWSTPERVDYALEGVIVSCGATIEWLKSELGLFADSKLTEEMAKAVVDNNGVYIIPAFSGLGAPHWDMNRRASIHGLSFDCGKNHIVRAALESIAYQVKDVIDAMQQDTGLPLQSLMVNGGISANQFVVQLIANLLACEVLNNGMPDASALGAAYLAGITAGVFKNGVDNINQSRQHKTNYSAGAFSNKAKQHYAEWLMHIRSA
jgi:glycerol kinase